ncbi:hypothetical protein TNCV_377051 [Trichonephila clavipes]|nr:hypothetical protein TNCV_377051 [Trichonephila clavipes]
MDSDDVQELLDSHNQELTIDELMEMSERDQDIVERELETLDPRVLNRRRDVQRLSLYNCNKGHRQGYQYFGIGESTRIKSHMLHLDKRQQQCCVWNSLVVVAEWYRYRIDRGLPCHDFEPSTTTV